MAAGVELRRHEMKIVLCLAVMITLPLAVGGPLTKPAAAAPTGKCMAFCRDWCATHARAQDY
jgi:hypothetical protein